MPRVSVAVTILIVISMAAIFQFCTRTRANPVFVPYQEYLAGKIAIGCGPGSSGTVGWNADAGAIPALPGWGSFTWKVTTSSDSAQYFFNQGISMYYSFHMIEAKASFRRAADFDPACAMAWWGLAMAYGVNYNYAMPKNAPEAMEAMAKAMQAGINESPLEKALIGTLPARYNADTAVSRDQQNKDYELAIKKVHEIFPDDANVAALHADALMVQHPWNLYDVEGKPRPWTPEIVTILERALARDPGHPSLNHLYIHAVEGASDAAKALPHAWRLSTMLPMVSHMVHMPSHIFIRTGHYREGMLVNDSSVNGFSAYSSAFPAVEGDAFLYLLHNLHMKAACTLYRGSAAEARDAAVALQQTVPADYLQAEGGMGNYLQYMYATPMFMQVRFGWWDSLLAAPKVNPNLKYYYAVQLFGKGMANAKKGKTAEAIGYLKELRESSKDPVFKEKFETINPAEKSIGLMISLLSGQVALAENDLSNARVHFENAVQQEDDFWYGEPRDWLLPTRHYLADVLLKLKDYSAAASAYQMELVINPRNVWSLYGLAVAQQGLGEAEAAQRTRADFEKANQDGDVKIKGSVM